MKKIKKLERPIRPSQGTLDYIGDAYDQRLKEWEAENPDCYKPVYNDKKLKIIGWIASIFSLLGTLLNAFQIIWCWPVWIAGNILWIYWSYKKREYSQLILWLVFEASNCFGWYKWFMLR